MCVKVLMDQLVQRDHVEIREYLEAPEIRVHRAGLETQVMSVVKVIKAVQVLLVRADHQVQQDCVVQVDLLDRLVILDLLDLPDRLVSFMSSSRHSVC